MSSSMRAVTAELDTKGLSQRVDEERAPQA